jgi:hypothetical protein
MKSNDSDFVYRNGLGAAGTVTAISTAFATLYPVLFGGGKENAKRRDRKRQALSTVGFNWIPTSGVPVGQEWNIDNWPDVSLDNIAQAYKRHGSIVPQLHNQKLFYPENTQTMAQIEQVIQQNGGTLNSGWGNQGTVNQSGFNAMPWLLGGSAILIGGALYKQSQEKK